MCVEIILGVLLVYLGITRLYQAGVDWLDR